jgi:T4-like virus tail tube protein gp19
MSLSCTYPGVYLSETTDIPQTVNPATTSLTAFIGDFAQGPSDQAVLVSSWVRVVPKHVGPLLDTSQLGNEVSLKDFRKDIQIELYNQFGQLVIGYNLYRCWPSQYTPLPELNADANGVALASLTLEHEGFDRDLSVVAPA